jgi:hypothetical protein
MSLDIFEMTTNISESTMKLINKKALLIFKHYQVDVKDIKCSLQWWEKHESMFLTFCLCVRQILGIIRSQIETKRIFSLVGILISLRRRHL